MNSSNASVILFDGVCNLCNWSVQFVLKYEKDETFKFATIQSEVAQKILAQFKNEEITDSVLLIEDGKMFQQSTAALKIAKKLKYFWILHPIIYFPKWLRDPIYNYIAINRYRWFGKREYCMIPDKKYKNRFL